MDELTLKKVAKYFFVHLFKKFEKLVSFSVENYLHDVPHQQESIEKQILEKKVESS